MVLALLLAAVSIVAFLAFARSAGASRSRPAFQGRAVPAASLLEGLLHALVSDRGYVRLDTRVLGRSGAAVMVEREGAAGRFLLVPTFDPSGESGLVTLRAIADRHAGDRRVTLVVIGGPPSQAPQTLSATAPIRAMYIDREGALHEARGRFRSSAPRYVIERALDQVASDLATGGFATIDAATAESLVAFEQGRRDPATESFPRPVTVALAVAILLAFVVQVAISRDSLFGSGASMAVAFRMGAIHRDAVLNGEWTRLIAAPFLHFGLIHLLMNTWAHWTLSTSIEFLLGSRRLLGLWLASAVGASMTSVALNEDAVSAGASGAIFGLLGAFAVFAFVRKDVLPQPVPRALRTGVVSTLLLNLMISFIPGIDGAAHGGGFVTGALVALFLSPGEDRGRTPRRSRILLPGVVALIFAAGVAWNSFQHRADLATQSPAVSTFLPLAGFHVPLPQGFSCAESNVGEVSSARCDGGPGTPFTIFYRVSDPQASEEAAERLLPAFRTKDHPAPEIGGIALSRVGVRGRRALEVIVLAPESLRSTGEEFGARLAAQIR